MIFEIWSCAQSIESSFESSTSKSGNKARARIRFHFTSHNSKLYTVLYCTAHVSACMLRYQGKLLMANGSFPLSLQESLPCSLAISKETSAGVRAFSSSSLFTASNLQKNGTSYAAISKNKKRNREEGKESERENWGERKKECAIAKNGG